MKKSYRLTFVLLPFAVGTAVLLLYLLFSFFSLDRNLQIAEARAEKAFRKGQFVENPYQHPNIAIGSHQWNDCLITMLALDQRGDRLRLALTPIIPKFPQHEEANDNPCAGLKALVTGEPLDPDVYHYDRYVHGAAALLRYFLPHFDVDRVRALYRAALTSVLVASFGLCLIGLARGRRMAEFAVVATTTLVLLRFFALEMFSQSLGHSPADLMIGFYLLAVSLMLFAPTGPTAAVAVAAVFGSVTMIFELFTGGMPLGFAMVIGLSTLAVRRDAPVQGVALAAWSATAFVVAAAVVYVLKLLAVASVAGPAVVEDVLQRARFYSMAAETGLDVPLFLRQVAESIAVLTGGVTVIAWAALGGAILAGVYGAVSVYRHATDAAMRRQALLLVLSVPPIPLWFLVFANETGVHAWYADRSFAWVIAAGFGLFLLALIVRRTAPKET